MKKAAEDEIRQCEERCAKKVSELEAIHISLRLELTEHRSKVRGIKSLRVI
jgi:hypothetical protein